MNSILNLTQNQKRIIKNITEQLKNPKMNSSTNKEECLQTPSPINPDVYYEFPLTGSKTSNVLSSNLSVIGNWCH